MARTRLDLPSSFGPNSTFTRGVRSMLADSIPQRSLTSSLLSHIPDMIVSSQLGFRTSE